MEKKEGRYKENKEIVIQDLPGIYSLSPYTLEEVVARNYLIGERPDAILNLVDGTNVERNLYLTTQLLELGVPVVIALNMMDVVNKRGDKIDAAALSAKLGCPVVEISALKGQGIREAMDRASALAAAQKPAQIRHQFNPCVESALKEIEALMKDATPEAQRRFFAVKLFERDEKILERFRLGQDLKDRIEKIVAACEAKMDDDSEAIITGERYEYIKGVVGVAVRRKHSGATMSDKIDRVVTNRWAALPIFAVVMTLVYYVAVSSLGGILTDWANDGVFGDGWRLLDVWIPGIPVLVERGLAAIGTADWMNSLILDGILGGVGAVLGFVPQMLILFLMLAFLEDCGYMARIAFIMDRVFRRFGLSGKSFIPMLIGSGCGVPGIMASRTIEQDRDRKMTIMTTTFIPCGAKMPIVALIAGAVFGGAWWVAPSAYFIGVAAIIISGILLKKTKRFAGEPAPFVMELPAYHMPTLSGVLRSMWERGWSFIKKAGTIIFLASILVWFTSNLGFTEDGFGMVDDMDASLLAVVGGFIAPLFAPLGFGTWQSSVATVLGLVAKEEVVGVFGTLYAVAGDALELVDAGAFGQLSAIAAHFTLLSAYSFLVFNLLCAPCFAAIGAMKREFNNAGWTWFAIGYQTGFAYAVALIVYQLGMFFTGNGFTVWTAAALAVLAGLCCLIFRPSVEKKLRHAGAVKARA